MYKVDSTKLALKGLAWVGMVFRIPVMASYGFSRPQKCQYKEIGIEQHKDQYCSGGYNEAFIFESWASYGSGIASVLVGRNQEALLENARDRVEAGENLQCASFKLASPMIYNHPEKFFEPRRFSA